MHSTKQSAVCVIVAAWQAEATIARAVRSALAEPAVGEVIVVDDASPDATVAAAEAADDGSGRLLVLRQEVNRGPSAARNRALEHSRAPWFAILDADDFLLSDRFTPLLATAGWDAVADNIAFMPEAALAMFDPGTLPFLSAEFAPLNLVQFVVGNMPRRGQPRAELGFLKPLIRRDFLDSNGLRYDESLRLGEDFVLYSAMLAAGARFATTRRVGYVAVERAASLSGTHATADLAALLAADEALLDLPSLSSEERSALHRHREQLRANHRHRRFLDDRRECGLGYALRRLGPDPQALALVAGRVLRDKLATPTAPSLVSAPRLLFSIPSTPVSC